MIEEEIAEKIQKRQQSMTSIDVANQILEITEIKEALELLEKTGDAYRVPPAVAELLVEDAPNNILSGVRHLSNCLRRWAELARVVRTGQPAERRPSVRGEAADAEAWACAIVSSSVL